MGNVMSWCGVALVSIGMLMPGRAIAQVTQATTTVHGLTCPFCSFGAKKRLKKVEGVNNIEIDVDSGLAILDAHPNQSIQVSQIPEALRKAGFSAGEVKVRAVGQVRKVEEQVQFHPQNSEQYFVLNLTENPQQEALLSASAQGTTLEISGLWSAQEGTPYGQLSPELIREI